MCLGVPGRIVEIHTENGLRMATIDFGGVQRAACLEYVPEAAAGDYAVIHVGFAISLLSEEEARETLETLRAIGEFEAEFGSGGSPG